MMPHNKTTVYLLPLLLFWCQPSFSAQKSINPLITYSCDVAADIVVITNSLLTPDEADTYNFSDINGKYNPWDLVEVDHVKQKTTLRKNSKIIKKCKLSSGEYTTTIEPKIFSRDLKAPCGGTISGAVTIEYDGIEILEKRPFENFCHGNAPIITRITTFGRTTEIKIKRIPKYKFY